MSATRELHPPSAPLPSPPVAIRTLDPAAEVLPWTGMSLLVALAGLFLLIAFPGGRPAQALDERLDREGELELLGALAELRRALVSHRAEHGSWPGEDAARAAAPAPAASDPWQRFFDRHFGPGQVLARNAGLELALAESLAPRLPGRQLPRNPANGLRSLRVLAPGESMPARPDGRTGWIFDPQTGELRANARGRLEPAGRRLFDL
jgi:hypothetical protein